MENERNATKKDATEGMREPRERVYRDATQGKMHLTGGGIQEVQHCSQEMHPRQALMNFSSPPCSRWPEPHARTTLLIVAGKTGCHEKGREGIQGSGQLRSKQPTLRAAQNLQTNNGATGSSGCKSKYIN